MDNPGILLLLVFILIIGATSFTFKIIHGNRTATNNEIGLSVGQSGPDLGLKIKSDSSNTATIKKPTPNPGYQAPTPAVTPNITPDFVISYTKNGFSPQTLKVKTGQTVRFVNQTSLSMRITSATSPNANGSPEFSQSTTVGYAGHFDVTAGRKGTFVYYNISDQKKAGALIVE